jgi:hypothetical protein
MFLTIPASRPPPNAAIAARRYKTAVHAGSQNAAQEALE